MKNIVLVPFLAAIILLNSFSTVGVRDIKIKKVVIDAGHGGKDSGTSGAFSIEKDIALKIARKAGEYIDKNLKGVEVIYTRFDDKFVELEERAQIANRNGADLFISIHCNSFPSPTVYGTETYVMGLHKEDANLQVAIRENSVIYLEDNYKERYGDFDPKSPESHIFFSLYQTAFLNNSINLATKIETQFAKRAGRRSRGVKQAGFWVLWSTSMPSVLVEIGYLSNPREEKDLNNELKQDYIASGIFRAVRAYKEEMDAME
ncbi:MAG: N-acetylmuramoyl-L-alanine amidase [Bacteroidetes bacterium]|nr:N-acetylmuramoyl-L-alanine amidase [Bacteroidota bacterium]